ncbi:MAG: helix-turn-helix domain-containing protein [Mediterraneibacter gnavus]
MFSGFLRKEREKRGISQERLCRGVCAVSALSRYENGERIPDRLLMNTLIERLGKSSDKLVTMISCQEYAYFEWKSKVKETLRKKKYCSGTGTHFEKRSTGRKCQPGFAGAVLSVYTGNRQWERGGRFLLWRRRSG